MLLSERNPEPGRTNRLQALPQGGLPKLVAFRGKAWQNPTGGGRAFASPSTQAQENISAKQLVPRPDEPGRNEGLPHEPLPDEPLPDKPVVAEARYGEVRFGATKIDPLYLFACGLSWRKQRSASAGWELVRWLRSPGAEARIAAAFLAETESGQLMSPELLPALNSPRKPPARSEPATRIPGRRSRR